MSNSLPIPIVRSKLYRPPSPRDLIDRNRLMEDNPGVLDGTATLVSAPAGYGKSTFVSQRVGLSKRECAWLSLDPEDSTPRRFLAYLVASLRTAVQDCCIEIDACLQMQTLLPVRELAGIFANDLDHFEKPVILVLDDYHHISAPDIHDFISAVLKRPPSNLHIVIITRRDPPLSLQGLRASGKLTEIRMQQLTFTLCESLDFIRQSMGDAISEQAITSLHQRTEGWPVSLRLAMHALPENSSVDEFVGGIPSDIHTVREYLLLEVLAKCTPAIRSYLLHTCFLERFCASLSEAVLQISEGGHVTDVGKVSGDDFIDSIRKAGLFAIALDSRQKWFRYHHLFQSMLQDQARNELGDDKILDIHCRAAEWLEHQDLLEEAISHLVQANMFGAAASLIVRHRNEIMNNEQWHRLEGWLQLLPDGTLEERPELLLLKARFLRTRGSREESWVTLEQADALLKTTSIDQELRLELEGSMESSRCYQLYAMSDGAGAVAAARRALELLPEDSLAERGFAFIILGAALQMTDDIQLARKTLYAAMSGCSGNEDASVTLSSRLLLGLGFVHWMDADLNALAPTAEQGSAIVKSAGLEEALAVSRSFQAAVLYHRNELATVHECFHDVTQNKVIANAEFYAQCLIISSLTHQELGNPIDAANNASFLHEFALKTQNAFLITQAEALNAEIALRQGQIAEALGWADRFEAEPFTPMYVFYAPAMTLAKVLVLEDSSKSRERADKLLSNLTEYLTRTHNKRFLIEVMALDAMLLEAGNHGEAARDKLAIAISMAQPAHFIRLFVDLGPRLGNLLHGLKLDEGGITYVGKILAAFGTNHVEPAPDVRLTPAIVQGISVEPLSKRERQVLVLLADRLSNKEIADQLNISTVTIKRHAANIYQKLGVHSRRQAVAKASGLGMFGESG